MPEWLVRLQGHEFDMEELSTHFTSAVRNVERDEDGHYYLRSSDFNKTTDSEAVRERALTILGYMNDAMTLYTRGSYRPVQLDVVTQIDARGQRHHHITLSSTVEVRDQVRATIIRADGTREDVSQPSDSAAALVSLADKNEKVADALRFYASGDWINLYKAWEVVCDAAGGTHAVVKKGWATERDRSRFTGTAQSRAELGDEARHASEKYNAPKDPMTLDEARGFVRSLIQAWVSTL
jgi:hypothetical protein